MLYRVYEVEISIKKTYFTKNIFKKYKLLFNKKQFIISININTIIEIPDHVQITYSGVANNNEIICRLVDNKL